VIEEDKDFPTHMYFSSFPGIEIEVKDSGETKVFGAPSRLEKAIQRIGLRALIRRSKRIPDDRILLSIGSRALGAPS
jgi:hypothetical protein